MKTIPKEPETFKSVGELVEHLREEHGVWWTRMEWKKVTPESLRRLHELHHQNI